ncbi:hypothetical protein AGOR_G00210570 [Albula goreensis]|uniref:THD domain-containing protein n=1 Tax=Albula goreensis TaxID=1534307 RepID=A0A8T3CLZ0_9TELE|nr:hypothetical protein AGOR_G00210570 [Albula goreensis]
MAQQGKTADASLGTVADVTALPMGHQKMWSQQFVLLLVWCGLLSVAVVILSVTQLNERPKSQNLTKENEMPKNPQFLFAPSDPRAGRRPAFIHLTIMNSKWIDEEKHSLSLRNDSVYINSSGFYYFYAHITFVDAGQRSVTLIRNAIPGQSSERTISETVGKDGESISVSRVIQCRRGQSLRLKISPNSCSTRHNPKDTYWGLFLLQP